MPHDLGPTVRLRLSADQVKLILSGLHKLIDENEFLHSHRYLRSSPRRANEYGRFDQWTGPSQDELQAITSAHEKLYAPANRTRRLWLSHDELAACIFATRYLDQLIRTRIVRPWKANHKKAGQRVRRTLENHRRRAKREIGISSRAVFECTPRS
jgi:hypothetical protein